MERKTKSPREHQGTDEPAVRPAGRSSKNDVYLVVSVFVVIIVVLFVVLYYVIVGSSPTTGEQAPTGCFGEVQATSNTTASAEFCVFSVNPAPINLKIVLEADTSTGTYTFHSNADWTVLTLGSGTDVGTITYRDFQDDGKAGAGDMLIITGLNPGTNYSVKMLWKDGTTLDTENFDTPA